MVANASSQRKTNSEQSEQSSELHRLEPTQRAEDDLLSEMSEESEGQLEEMRQEVASSLERVEEQARRGSERCRRIYESLHPRFKGMVRERRDPVVFEELNVTEQPISCKVVN